MSDTKLSRAAYIAVLSWVVIGVCASVAAIIVDPRIGDLWALFVFTLGASLAQLYLVYASPRLGYDISLAFLFAAVIVLPAPSVVLLSVLMFLPIWTRARFPWYMPLFNMANYAIPALVAKLIVSQGPVTGVAGAGRILLATVVFTLVNHAALAVIVRLARGETLRQSRLFSLTHISLDTLVLCSGAAIALLWQDSPVSSLFAMLPLFLIARALQIPKLEQESWTDPKTDLYNARFFWDRGDDLVQRGKGSTALAMLDLDFLREVNNQYGHLAGDSVITRIGQLIRARARGTDLAARFGGEEFAILMPSTSLADAAAVAERMREAIEKAEIETEGVRLRVTVSIGVTAGQDTLEELIRYADRALYQAKDQGRNRVVIAEEALAHDFGAQRHSRGGSSLRNPV